MIQKPRNKAAFTPWGYLWTGAALILVLGFYHWTFLTNYSPPPAFPYYTGQGANLYNLSVEGYLHGILSFVVKPGPELLALPDPYDNIANAAYCIRETSLYNGHYYLYFGPVPAISIFLPLRLLIGHHTNDAVAVAAMGAGCFLISFLTLLRFRSILPANRHFLPVVLCTLALGINNFYGHFLRRPQIFEVAIISAAFWMLISVYFMVSYFAKNAKNGVYLVLSGMCFGLAVGCRYSYLLCFLMLLLPAVHFYRCADGSKDTRWAKIIRRLGMTASPFGLVLGLLMLHNYMRFDSPFEFGQKYQLTAVTISKLKLTSLSYVPHNLNHYFLSFIKPDVLFPFFHEFSNHPLLELPTPQGYHAVWNSVGVFNSPFLAFTLLTPVVIYFSRKRMRSSPTRKSLYVLATTGIPALCNIIVLLCFCGIVVRYLQDFVLLLLLLACINFLICDSIFSSSKFQLYLVRILTAFLIFYGIIVNVGLSMEGEYKVFSERANPKLFRVLENYFSFVPRLFFNESEYGGVRLTIRFPQGASQLAEPLVTTGEGWLADMLSVDYPTADSIRFGFYHGLGDATGFHGETVKIDRSQSHIVDIYMGSLFPRPLPFLLARNYNPALNRTLRVFLDGRLVLAGSMDFYDSLPRQFRVGTNSHFPISPYFNPGMFTNSFSGSIFSRSRISPFSTPP